VICIREPSGFITLSPKTGELGQLTRLSTHGPHGLDIHEKKNIAYFACDGGKVIAYDLDGGFEIGSVKIPSEPDVTWFNPRKNLLYSALPKSGLILSIDVEKMSEKLSKAFGLGIVWRSAGQCLQAVCIQRHRRLAFQRRTSWIRLKAVSG
jgi:hypothetical protein